MRDSNPRYQKAVYRISSPAHSITLPIFLFRGTKIIIIFRLCKIFSMICFAAVYITVWRIRARVMGMQTKKGCSFLLGTAFLRDSDRIQTCNLLIRSQMLYSVELRSLVSCLRLQRYAYFLFPPNFFRYFFVFSSKNIRKSIFRLLFPLQYGQGYVIFHGKEPYRTYYQE